MATQYKAVNGRLIPSGSFFFRARICSLGHCDPTTGSSVLYSVQCTTYGRSSTWTGHPIHSIANLNSKWDAHIRLQRHGARTERIKVAGIPHIMCSSSYH